MPVRLTGKPLISSYAFRPIRLPTSAFCSKSPFCGVGTIPAVANALGLDALGLELAKKRCEQSRAQTVTPADL